jgi:very-short-patch-repair endonuclease
MHPEFGVEREVSLLAQRQRGRVTRAQLLEAGLTRRAIEHRLKAGRLHRVRPGVYAVGHLAAMPLGDEVAALLSCGEGAVLSHRSAAKVWGLPVPASDAIDVTVIGRDCGDRRGVRRHRVPFLDAVDLRHRHGIALTAPARTILDVAPDLTLGELERLIGEGLVKKLLSHKQLEAALQRAPGRRGTSAVRAILEQEHGPRLTRSEVERKLLVLVRAARLPVPETNARLHGYEVDALWREHRLVVEVDGYGFHSSRAAFERDRRKDADLQEAGYRVLRITWLQLEREPYLVVARLARALADYAE